MLNNPKVGQRVRVLEEYRDVWPVSELSDVVGQIAGIGNWPVVRFKGRTDTIHLNIADDQAQHRSGDARCAHDVVSYTVFCECVDEPVFHADQYAVGEPGRRRNVFRVEPPHDVPQRVSIPRDGS